MKKKFVARAEPGKGWRVFNRKTQRHWGNFFKEFPEAVLNELNGEKRPEVLSELGKKMKKAR